MDWCGRFYPWVSPVFPLISLIVDAVLQLQCFKSCFCHTGRGMWSQCQHYSWPPWLPRLRCWGDSAANPSGAAAPTAPCCDNHSLASGFGAPLEVGCKRFERFDISDILVHDRYVIVRQCKADTMLAELTRSGTAGLAPSLTVSPPDLYDFLALPCWSPLGLRWSPGTTWYNEVLKVVILCKFCRCNMCMKLYECVWYFSCSSVVIAVQTYSMQGNTCMSNFRLAPAWSWSKLPNALVPRQIFPPLFTKGLTHGPKPCLIVMVYWPIYGRSCVTAHYVCALFCRWGWWVKTCEDPTSGESYGRFICLSREIRSWSAFQCYPCHCGGQ